MDTYPYNIVTSWTLKDAIKSANECKHECNITFKERVPLLYKWFSISINLPPCEDETPWDVMTDEQKEKVQKIFSIPNIAMFNQDGIPISNEEYMNEKLKKYNFLNTDRCISDITSILSSEIDVINLESSYKSSSVFVKTPHDVDSTVMIRRLYAACSRKERDNWSVDSIRELPNSSTALVEKERKMVDNAIATFLTNSYKKDKCIWFWEKWVNDTSETLEKVNLKKNGGDIVIPNGLVSIGLTTVDFGTLDSYSNKNIPVISDTQPSIGFFLIGPTNEFTIDLNPGETRFMLRCYITEPLRSNIHHNPRPVNIDKSKWFYLPNRTGILCKI